MKQAMCGLGIILSLLGTVRAEELPTATSSTPSEPPSISIIGMGQGDLSKGRLICERVAELAARADVARQIRVHVKEEIRDRVRERTGRDVEQDIEIVREERVSESLERVRIVEHTVDTAAGICTSKAVMLKQGTRRDQLPASETPQRIDAVGHSIDR